jgi:hypothetical protein
MARPRGALAAATLVVALLCFAYVLDPLPEGLNATFFSDANWSAEIVRTMVDPRLSTESAFAAWRGSPPDVFSATWSGTILVVRDGTYTFATASDDGSWLYVDRQLVVDNGGNHATRLAKASLHLTRGVHALFVKHFQSGGPFDLEVTWARGDAPLEAVPAWALAPRSVSFVRFLASVAVRRAVRWALWLGLAVAIVALAASTRAPLARYAAAPTLPSIETCLLATGALMLLFVLPHEIESDGRVRYLALAQLFEWREVSPIPYSLAGPLFSAPLYLLGKVVLTSEWWCARFNALVFIAGIVVAYRLLQRRLDATVLMPFLLLLVAASMFPHHVQQYYAEVFTAVLVALGLAAVASGHAVAGWTAAIAGVVNTPVTVVALAAPALWHARETRRLRHLVPVLVAAGAIAIESWIRRGSPFVTGYEANHGEASVLTYAGRPGFSYPLLFGLLSVLLSFGKGLVFYAPGLLRRVGRHDPHVSDSAFRCYKLWMVFLAALILIYSKWWAWYGGWYWGPRFFLFAAFPACLALAVGLAGRRQSTLRALLLMFAALSLSAWVAIDGVVFQMSGLGVCRDVNFEALCWYVPEFSPLWRPFVEFTRPPLDRAAVGAYFCVVYAWLAIPLVREILNRLTSERSTQPPPPPLSRASRTPYSAA